jgi:hypothetical protein
VDRQGPAVRRKPDGGCVYARMWAARHIRHDVLPSFKPPAGMSRSVSGSISAYAVRLGTRSRAGDVPTYRSQRGASTAWRPPVHAGGAMASGAEPLRRAPPGRFQAGVLPAPCSVNMDGRNDWCRPS